jgi:hypothetical protein
MEMELDVSIKKPWKNTFRVWCPEILTKSFKWMCVCACFFGWNKCSHHVNYIRWKYLNSPCWARGQTWRWCDHLDNLGRWDLAVSHSFTVKKATKSEASVVILGRIRRLSDFQQGSRIKKCEKAQLVKPHILSVPSHPVCGRVRTIRWLDHCSPSVQFMWFHLIGYHHVRLYVPLPLYTLYSVFSFGYV